MTGKLPNSTKSFIKRVFLPAFVIHLVLFTTGPTWMGLVFASLTGKARQRFPFRLLLQQSLGHWGKLRLEFGFSSGIVFFDELREVEKNMGIFNSKPKLSRDDLEFLKRNTKFSEKEIKKWYKGFIKNCPQGHLSKAQFMDVYRNFFPSGAAERFCEHAFRTFDADNSGYVDFREFLMAVNVTSSGTPKQKLEWAFRMYDIDGSGFIEEKEIVKILESIYDMLGPDATKVSQISPTTRARMIFQKMDTNRDKELTLKEFVDGCINDKELYQMLTNSEQ